MIYFDFDGTLKEWNTSASLEQVGCPDYPLRQAWIEPMKEACKKLCEDFPDQVTILTAVLNPDVARTKKYVIEKEFGKQVADKMVMSYYNGSKRKLIRTGYPKLGIKFYNGINGNHGCWDGLSVHMGTADEIYKSLKTMITNIYEVCPYVDILIDDFTKNLLDWEAMCDENMLEY